MEMEVKGAWNERVWCAQGALEDELGKFQGSLPLRDKKNSWSKLNSVNRSSVSTFLILVIATRSEIYEVQKYSIF